MHYHDKKYGAADGYASTLKNVSHDPKLSVSLNGIVNTTKPKGNIIEITKSEEESLCEQVFHSDIICDDEFIEWFDDILKDDGRERFDKKACVTIEQLYWKNTEDVPDYYIRLKEIYDRLSKRS